MTMYDCFHNYDMELTGTGMSGNSTGIAIKQVGLFFLGGFF